MGDICDIKHGYAFQGVFFSDTPTNDILLTPGNFKVGGGFKGDNYHYYIGEVPEDYILDVGDLILTMTDLSKNSDTLGFPALVPKVEGLRFLHNQRLGKVILINDKVDKYYLYYAFCTDKYRNEVLASATGTTVKHTSPKRILSYRFSIPQIDEQKSIAHILGTLDEKIELNRRMNETLEGIARALFKSWFIDFDPVRAKAEGHQPFGMDQETAALFPDQFEDSELGEIPKGWKVKSLDEIAKFLNGLALQKYPPRGIETLPVIKIAELNRGINKGTSRASNVPDDYIVNDGDVLFSWSGSLELKIWCEGKGALNQHLFKVTSDDFPSWFYYQWVAHHLDSFRKIAAGKATTMGHIQRHHLTEALTVVPTVKILDISNNIFMPLFELYINNSLNNRYLSRVRDCLLPKLISGDLRVDPARFSLGPEGEKVGEV